SLSLSAPKKPVYGLIPNPVWASVTLPRNRPEPESVSCRRAGCDLPLRVTVPSMAPPAAGGFGGVVPPGASRDGDGMIRDEAKVAVPPRRIPPICFLI